MICSKCGAENPEGSGVCGNCGAPLTPEKPTLGKLFGGDKTVSLPLVIGGAVLAIVLLIWIISMIFGGGAKGAALKYVKATDSKNGGKTLIDLMPDAFVEELLDQSDEYEDEKEWVDSINENLEKKWENAKETKQKTSYKVIDVIKKKNMSATALDSVKDAYEDKYDVKVSDAATVYIYSKTKNEDGVGGGFDYLPMVKIGGKWYIDINNEYIASMISSAQF